MADTFRVLKGISYPASKALRNKIRKGKASSNEAKEWKRHKAGTVTGIPADLIPEFKRRGAIEKEA